MIATSIARELQKYLHLKLHGEGNDRRWTLNILEAMLTSYRWSSRPRFKDLL